MSQVEQVNGWRRVDPFDVPGEGRVRQVPDRPQAVRTVADVLVETLVAHGVTRVFGMVGHFNLGFADALRRAESEVTCSSSGSGTRALLPSRRVPTAS